MDGMRPLRGQPWNQQANMNGKEVPYVELPGLAAGKINSSDRACTFCIDKNAHLPYIVYKLVYC
jgi:hypothetical protein